MYTEEREEVYGNQRMAVVETLREMQASAQCT